MGGLAVYASGRAKTTLCSCLAHCSCILFVVLVAVCVGSWALPGLFYAPATKTY